MIVYISGVSRTLVKDNRILSLIKKYRPSIMQSFYTEKKNILSEVSDDIMIDSGAFSMLADKNKSKINIYKYADEYAEFLKKNNVKLYMELDLDSIISYENVLKIRNDLQKKTGVKPIPVWHKRLGIEEFKKMCKNYPYVAIGGLVTKEIKKREFPHLRTLISMAHDYGVKIHGLGFTATKVMPLYKFDSVDSSSWLNGRRFSNTSIFTGKYVTFMHRRDFRGRNMYMKDLYDIEAHDMYEWIKYQSYAKEYL